MPTMQRSSLQNMVALLPGTLLLQEQLLPLLKILIPTCRQPCTALQQCLLTLRLPEMQVL